METLSEQLIEITPSAKAELIRLSQDFKADQFIRIGVKGGGCSGLTYILDETTATESDEIIDFGSLRIAVNKAQALYLKGVRLDFGTGLDNRGFIFDNPNASSTCGCGTSFAI